MGIVVDVGLIIGGQFMGSRNDLVTEKNDVDARWAQVDNDMKCRADLIPNLVETVKGYAKQEQTVIGEVANARAALLGPTFDGHPTLVSLLHQAADRTSVSYADPAYLHSAGLREAARELRTESILLAHQGRYAEAVTDQARGFNVAKQFASSPGLGEYLTGDAANAITFSGLYAILKMAGPDAGVAAEVRQAVEAARPVLPLKAALLADVPPDVQSLETLRRASPQAFLQMTTDARAAGVPTVAWKAWTPSQRRFLDRLVDATEAQYLSEVRRLVAATETPDLARHRVFAAVQDGRDALPDSPVTQLDPLLSDSRMLARAFGTLDQVDTRARARIAVTLAATALLTAKAQAGAFPDALPGDFADPSTGKALGYRREGVDGFVVYSVGPDGTFGGGEPGGRDFQTHQVYFRYPGLTPKPVPADMLK